MAKKLKPPLVTTPKPFVFVLMPFSPDFNDIYEFGIQGAAEDAGAYAERLDEQIFAEGMLERIFNQIAKSDVVVADMSTRNANVFYEVGYAHALGKTVLLITQQADDIPFDLKHKQHIVYGGKISDLRPQLAKSLRWAITESKRGEPEAGLSAFLGEQRLPGAGSALSVPTTRGLIAQRFDINIAIHNNSPVAFPGSSYIYILTEERPVAIPQGLRRRKIRQRGGFSPVEEEYEKEDIHELAAIMMQKEANETAALISYRLETSLAPIPPGMAELISVPFLNFPGVWGTSQYRLKIHSGTRNHDFYFGIEMIEPPTRVQKNTEFARFEHLADEPGIDDE